MTSRTVERVLAALEGHGFPAKPHGGGWMACCPGHEDRRPSLSIGTGDDGRALVHCFAGCAVESVCKAIGLSTVDLYPEPPRPSFSPNNKATGGSKKGGKTFPSANQVVACYEGQPKLGKRSADWTYHDASGEPVGMTLRWDKAGGKEIRPVSRHADGWRPEAMPEPRPLYRLPDVIQASRVLVVEGEKCADQARALGFVVTTSAGGCKAAGKADWQPLAGKDVWILPDNDPAGHGYADTVAGIVSRLDPPAAARIVALPNLPDKGDICDWIDGHGDAAEPASMREEIEALAKACPPWTGQAQEGHAAPDEQSAGPADNPLIVSALDNTAFHAAEFRHDWLIENLLVANEPCVAGGPSKALKTGLLVDAAVSLASGRPFLGQYRVPRPSPVYVVSAESGPASLQARMRHVCKAKGIDPEGLPIHWYTRVEMLATPAGCANLAGALAHFGSKVCILDPSYLLLGGEVTTDNAGNMFAMGRLLANVGEACARAGATLVIATHANGKLPVGEPMELSHLAWSGFQQWARQWLLVSRRTKYDDDGRHELFLRYGGSAGHTGLLHVDVDEGVFDGQGGGKKWEVAVLNAGEARKAERQAEAEEELRELNENADAVLKAMLSIIDDVTTVATRNALHQETGLPKKAVGEAVQKLVGDGAVVEVEGKVRCGLATKKATGIRRPESWSE